MAPIQRIETFHRGRYGLVRVTAADGAVGWGQVAPQHADLSATLLHRIVARCFLGTEPEDLAATVQQAEHACLKFPWSFVMRAVGGIDTAVWDLRGRLAGKPVYALASDAPMSRVRVYGSSLRRDITPEDEAARMRRLRDERGFAGFKTRVASKDGGDREPWPGRSEALIPHLRHALGDDVTLLADANSGYSVERAIAIGRLMQDHGYAHFEEPCPWWRWEQSAAVAAALEMPVAGGEQNVDLADWRRLLAAGAVDIAQPDLCYVGGYTRALAVAAMAAEHGIPVVPHSANHSLVTTFAAHLLAAVPNRGPHLEWSIEDQSEGDQPWSPRLVVDDGHVDLGDRPGWGVEVDPSWVEGAERQVSELG